MFVAVKREDRVVVGITICDTYGDMTEKDLSLPDNIPFWKVKGEKNCYVCTDDINYSSDLLRYNDYVFKGVTDGKSVMENVLPKMYKLLYKNNRLLEDKTWRNRALIIKDNKLFLIDNDLCVLECDEVSTPHYEAYLIPVIKETADLDPTESILRAFRYANKMRNANFFPVTVFDSKTKRKKVFYK